MPDKTAMTEEQAFLAWLKWGVIGVLGFVTLMVGSCQMTNFYLAQAIKAGADPLEARCALDVNPSQNCMILYGTKREP